MLDDFSKTPKWWRTGILSDVVLSADGIGELLRRVGAEKERPFFILDDALVSQSAFDRIVKQEHVFLFNASASEPRTGDVDNLVELIRRNAVDPDVIVGVGGGGSMDLAKAVGMCLANPNKAQEYQGYGLDMNRGVDVGAVPTLNGTGAELTPIAVLRGPEKKLGINNSHAAPRVAVLDPQLSKGCKHFNNLYRREHSCFHDVDNYIVQNGFRLLSDNICG